VSGLDGFLDERRGNEFMVRARLRDGVTLTQAQEAMTALGASLTREYPREDPGRGISVLRADEVLIHPQLDRMVDAGAGFLTVVVAMLLAIVCTNLATWLLVRGLARQKEVSVRLALGASRARVVRHLVVESTLLAGLGGAVGCLVAVWTMGLVSTLDLPVEVGGGLDHRILIFTVALSLLTGVAFGLAPALGATRGRLAPALRGDGDIGSGRGRRVGLKHALVAAQVVLSCVFLGVEGVYLQALRATQDADVGFEAERLAFVETDPAFAGYSADRSRRLHETLRERVAALPGVESATLTVGRPPGWDGGGAAIIEGYEPVEDESVYLPWIWAGPEYFEAFGIPLVRGRGFGEGDRPDTPPVAVVNESLARRYFGTADPVGRRVRVFEGPGTPDAPDPGTELEIVGVVPDVRTSLLDPPGPLFYRASRQGAPAPSTVVVRTAGDPATLLPAMQRVLRDLDATVPVTKATTVDRALSDELGPGRAVVAVVGVLGILGLGLASLGLYAVVAFAVSRRSREIGIRTALGARRSEVIWTLSRDVATLMAGSLALGLGAAWLLVRSLGGLVSNLGQAEGVNLNAAPDVDPVSFAAVALLMAVVGLTATLVPAWHASGKRPLAALREL
jgi:putative ABC transport system permease protein